MAFLKHSLIHMHTTKGHLIAPLSFIDESDGMYGQEEAHSTLIGLLLMSQGLHISITMFCS